ncbi:MAG TPA: 4'-phosphopantetheinyl transferase superfamily protein [Rhodanobacteraceae bacterium]|nr:4'-phosphopantetheinyl transferase superfamily protein [Rhodanobacteraceae bacterium]
MNPASAIVEDAILEGAILEGAILEDAIPNCASPNVALAARAFRDGTLAISAIAVGAPTDFAMQRDMNPLTRTLITPKHARMRLLSASDFIPARFPVALSDDEVQVWLLAADNRPDAPHRYASRVSTLLAAYLGCAPDDVRVAIGEHGKPFLDGPVPTGPVPAGTRAFDFNVSHCRGALLVGIARGQELGVDIEAQYRKRPVLDLARRFFAAAEASALAGLDEPQRQIAFLRLWSCKEAVVKAIGIGIGFGLARVQFGVDPAGEPVELSVIHASAGAVEDWHVVRLAPTSAHVGALAWRGPPLRVRAFVAAADWT